MQGGVIDVAIRCLHKSKPVFEQCFNLVTKIALIQKEWHEYLAMSIESNLKMGYSFHL